MSVEYNTLLINANVVLTLGKTHICKVIKQYMYTQHKHHLIGVLYYDAMTNVILHNVKELSISYKSIFMSN